MKVSDILRVKGGSLYTASPEQMLAQVVPVMAQKDIGSLVVMSNGELVGMLTFREIIQTLVKGPQALEQTTVRAAMDDAPLSCTPQTELDEVRRIMLERHTRYLPVLEQRSLLGVISFYDVARAVVESQGFENQMLKAYIRDWPEQA